MSDDAMADHLKWLNEREARIRELEAVVSGFRTKLATYVSVYPGDKELRRLLSECDAALRAEPAPIAEGKQGDR